jgi:hypothetical protein
VVEKLSRFEVPGAFLQISREKSENLIFLNYFWTEKSMDSVHGAVDRGAIGPPWTGGHCRARELTGARHPAAPVPVIPRSEKDGTKPPYVCPGCSTHTYSNNMVTRFHVQ